ncbi:hypothetical protein D910_12052, partial [Dendroctonus ponderosae]
MVASTTNNAARKVILVERKKQIEEKLAKCNHDLRALCIQEAELTGITPPEMPLEIGETPPTIRRKVGTAFQLNENLVNNSNKDQLVTNLELEIQLHMKLRDAALGLSGEGNISKTVKRQHRAEYQKHKEQVKALEEKLALLKEKTAFEQIKQKKKSRIPDPQDDNISVITNEAYSTLESRQNHISNKHGLIMLSPTDTYPESRYPPSTSRQSHYSRNSESIPVQYAKPDELLTAGFYRLSVNGYNEYIESQEEITSVPHYNYPIQNFGYSYPHSSHSQSLLMQQHSPSAASQNSSQLSQHSPHLSQSIQYLPHQNLHYPQHSPLLSQHSPMPQQGSISQQSPQTQRKSPHLSQSPLSQHSMSMQRSSQNFSRISQQYVQMRQSSPTSHNKVQYYSSHTIHGEPMYNRYTVDASGYRNSSDTMHLPYPHPIQPHQQYENNGMSSGLGGSWKRSESGQMYWVYSSNTFGSLDRRKNKRVQRRISPIDSKSATLATVPTHSDQMSATFVKPQVANRRSQDHRQLVRTQSLGSVGQTIDSVYPSDDTSSCESDNRSFKDVRGVRKQKEKEWLETSLDGPISPTSVTSRSQSTLPSSFEEKYVARTPPPPPPPPQLSPHNCTIVQAGVVKPYHEETKPFEMSDFYKYSTKFKKSPQKELEKGISQAPATTVCRQNLNDNFEDSINMNRYPVRVQQQYMQH